MTLHHNNCDSWRTSHQLDAINDGPKMWLVFCRECAWEIRIGTGTYPHRPRAIQAMRRTHDHETGASADVAVECDGRCRDWAEVTA